MHTEEFVKLMREAKVVGILRASRPEAAVAAGQAAIRGGLRLLEVAYTTPDALEAVRELSRLTVVLGVGTVLSRAQGEAALEAGASFLISPHLGEDLLALSLEAGVPYLPGVLTPTEIQRALSLGAQVLKLFPIGSSGGVAYLKDLLGPFPGLQVMVTGGVDLAQVPQYLQVGALAVGLGSNLFPKEAMQTGDWSSIEAATRVVLAMARMAV